MAGDGPAVSTRPSGGRWPALLAFLLSFAVYVLPVVLPHALLPLGAFLAIQLTGAPLPASVLMLGVAAAVQLIAGVLLWRFFRRPRWSAFAALVAAVPVFFVTLEWLYLVTIPGLLYVARDTAPERATWPVECSVEGADVALVASPTSLALERAGEGWVRRGETYGLLELPGCHVRNLASSRDTTVPFVVPGGRGVYAELGGARYVVLPDGSRERLEDRSRNDAGPILSNDGAWVAWVVPEPAESHLLARHLADGRELRVGLAAIGAGSFEPVELDVDRSEVVVMQNGGQAFVVLGLDGAVRGAPMTPAPLRFVEGFRRFQDGWVTWGQADLDGPGMIAWSFAGRTGRHEVLKGRALESVAVQPAGRLVAASVVPSMHVGNARPAVYVLELPSGAEVFRKYFSHPYDRTSVAFAGDEHLAYTDGSAVRVLRVPR